MIRKIIITGLTIGLLIAVTSLPAQAITPEEIKASIQTGIGWLVSQQNPNGSWGYNDRVAKTGFALVKLEDRAFLNKQIKYF